MMNPPIPASSPTRTNIRVERLSACAAGVPLGVGVTVGVTPGVRVGLGVGVGVTVPPTVAVAVAVGVDVGVNVAVGVGEPPPQLPLTLNTMCMFGNPSAAVVVGVVTPQAAALK